MYFKVTYDQARKAFAERASQVEKKYPGSRYVSVKMPPAHNDELFTDLLYIPSKKQKAKLLIITSGLHGIEGHTGSAVQNMLIDKFLLNKPSTDVSDFAFLWIHSLNPYGHKHNRRVNENNIDLNRNFVLDEGLFSDESSRHNVAYKRFNDFLNPPVSYKKNLLNQFKYFGNIIKLIGKNGIKMFRQAVLQGQYEFEKGIFFGGKSFQAQKSFIDQILEEYISAYDENILIDIHTGYGYRGELHLIGMDAYPHPEILEKLRYIYPESNIEAADAGAGDFYKINGALFDYMYHKISKKGKKLYPIAWEFGTNDNIKTLKSLSSLQTMIYENQIFHHGAVNPESEEKIKRDYRELFYPQSEKWRKRVLEKSSRTFELLLKKLKE